MRLRLALAFSSCFFAIGALAGNANDANWFKDFGTDPTLAPAFVDPDWSVDYNSVRVLKADAMIIGGPFGDQILFDIRHNGVSGTLSLSCASGEYAVATSGLAPVTDGEPTVKMPLAELLASTYCARIDDLPRADTMTPLEVRLN